MSGRGKGGKGLGKGSNKKAKLEPHKWTEGEEVVIVTFVNAGWFEVRTRTLPFTRVHSLLTGPLISVLDGNLPEVESAELTITLGEDADEENDDWFKHLTKKDLKELQTDDDDDDDDDDAEELDDSGKEFVLEELDKWIEEKLFSWDNVHGMTNVKIIGYINFFQKE